MGYKNETWGGNKYKVPDNQYTRPVYSGSSSNPKRDVKADLDASKKKNTGGGGGGGKKGKTSSKASAAASTDAKVKVASGGYGGGSSSGDSGASRDEYLKKLQALAKKIYKQNMNAINETYTGAGNTLKTNYDSTTGQLKDQFDYQNKSVNTDAENSMRQAYINSMLQQKDLGQKMSAQGLNGGMSETTMASLNNNYSNARNNIDTTRQKSLSDLNQTYTGNLAEAQRQYNTAVQQLAMQRAEAEQAARNAYLQMAINYQFDPGSLSMPKTDYATPMKTQANYTYTPTQAVNYSSGVNTTQGSATINEAKTNYARYLAQQRASGASLDSIKNDAYSALKNGEISGSELVDILNQLGIAV